MCCGAGLSSASDCMVVALAYVKKQNYCVVECSVFIVLIYTKLLFWKNTDCDKSSVFYWDFLFKISDRSENYYRNLLIKAP